MNAAKLEMMDRALSVHKNVTGHGTKTLGSS